MSRGSHDEGLLWTARTVVSDGQRGMNVSSDIIVEGDKDIHVPVPETCDYDTLHGKRDCMDVIGKRSRDGELMLDLSGWV